MLILTTCDEHRCDAASSSRDRRQLLSINIITNSRRENVTLFLNIKYGNHELALLLLKENYILAKTSTIFRKQVLYIEHFILMIIK